MSGTVWQGLQENTWFGFSEKLIKDSDDYGDENWCNTVAVINDVKVMVLVVLTVFDHDDDNSGYVSYMYVMTGWY